MEYIVDKRVNANGQHEVHNASCSCLPAKEDSFYIGEFDYSFRAVNYAKTIYANANGCFECCPESHYS